MSGHTPTPWRNACFQVYGADNSRIAHTGMGQLPPSRATESEASAAFIVKAVNSHDDLVKALESLVRAYGAEDGRNGNSGECWDLARAALSSAVGTVPDSGDAP